MNYKLNNALKALKDAQEQLASVTAQMQRFPEEPPIGTVIVFHKKFHTNRGELAYSYAAIRAGNGLWYCTGWTGGHSRANGQTRWDALVEWIGDSDCRIATDFRVV